MTPSSNQAVAAPARLGGLDGLRAIAVGLVLVYHLVPAALPGGFLGVDIFFVISGFLISTLLLSEHRRTGKIALVSFWRRRARRLLPALGLVLLVCTSLALLLGGDVLVNIGAQLSGAALFVANWVYIALGSDYFAQDNPELFRNTWSLAIEEQFYVLLPLVLLFAFRMRARSTRALFFALLGFASAVWMATLFLGGAPASRVYFGTDTHVFGLLLGVALAYAVRPWNAGGSSSKKPLAGWKQLALLLFAAAGIAVLVWLSFTLREGSPASFTGGFQIATLAMLLVVWAVSREGAWAGRALDVQPLKWIGERSYGIYLWHWPLLLLVGEFFARSGGFGGAGAPQWVVAVVTAALTFTFASLSYRYIEQPVRRIGFRRALTQLVRPVQLRGRPLLVGLSLLALLVVTVPATGVAVAVAPEQSSSADAITRGQAALEAMRHEPASKAPGSAGVPPRATADAKAAEGSKPSKRSETSENGKHTGPANPTERNAPLESSTTSGSVSEGVQPTGEPTNDAAPQTLIPKGFDASLQHQPHFEVEPDPVPIEDWEIFAVGDSVMLASAPELVEAFPKIWIDADVSRGLHTGVEIVRELEAAEQLRSVIVVGLGTNGPISLDDLDELRRIGGDRRVVLVNAFGDRWWIPEVNQQLRAYAEKHAGVTLADWESAIVQVPGGLAGDDIHPNPSGGVAYAQTVQQALDALLEKDERVPAGKKR